MLFNNKKTEINKIENQVLEITRFCAEMTIQKRLWFSRTTLVEKKKKENGEEFKTYSLEILFLTLSEEEKKELIMNGFEIHPKIFGEMVFKKRKNGKFSLEKINFTITTNLKENLISPFFFSNELHLTESFRFSSWMSEEQKKIFAEFMISFVNFI